MALYSMKFGFRQPYQVLVDSEMCKSATDLKIELVKQLGTVLQGEVKPMMTQCCIHELYLQGKTQQPAVDLAKTFERRKCNHREPIPGDECLTRVVGDTNKHRYVIATQSQPLRVKLRTIPATPLVHVNRTVMVLEPPSDVTIQAKQSMEEQALHPTASDMTLVSASGSAEPIRKKRKGPKGPNPLSVKKKKVVEASKARPRPVPVTKANVGEKRKRGEENKAQGEDEIISNDVEPPQRKRRRKKAGQSTEGDT